MPELPEVEIVRQSLLKNIKGKKINKVLVRNRNLRFKLETSFEKKLKNKFISNIKRFSKYLIIELENKSFCIVHLGMSGTIHIIKNKKGLVQGVFDKVFDRYDLMNDFMSFGIHRLWKKNLINMMGPSKNKSLIDVACGTGDIGKLYLDNTDINNHITCIDPNKGMVAKGKEKLKNYKNVKWIISSAEKLPLKSNSFDFYTISFGLRNTKDLDKSLSEAYRVLKKGGRFFCLEFSKIQNKNLELIYKNYSKLIPLVGKYVVGQREPYDYLIKSIDNFVNQEELLQYMKVNKFQKCNYRNFSNGIISIDSGWKV